MDGYTYRQTKNKTERQQKEVKYLVPVAHKRRTRKRQTER